MRRDIRGLPVSTDSAEAVTAFDTAVEHAIKFHRDTPVLVGQAIAGDPGWAMGHVFRGYLLSLAANPANLPAIRQTLDAARAASASTAREKLHIDALEAWSRDAMPEAFAIWRRILEDSPTDLLAVRMRDTNWFRHGQTWSIRAQADWLAPFWGGDTPGYDCFRSIWAFAHEETADYRPAERAVDEAVATDPANFFAHHVKAHILEMENRAAEGRDWLVAHSGTWPVGNALVHHLWWHQALMELELGQLDTVFARYDQDIRNFDDPLTKATPDFYVDLQNATALLWRLEQSGVNVGARWEELADKAEALTGNTGHPLSVPHLMMALAATGRDAAGDRFLDALRQAAAVEGFWNAVAVRDVIIPVCEAVRAYRKGDNALVVDRLLPLRDRIRVLGGSAAQRDMFNQMLVHAAMKAGRRDVVRDLIGHEAATRSVSPRDRVGYRVPALWMN